jgi:hypothetical protein
VKCLRCNMKSLAVHPSLNKLNEEQKDDTTLLPSQESEVKNLN